MWTALRVAQKYWIWISYLAINSNQPHMALSAGSWMEKIYQAKANFFSSNTQENCVSLQTKSKTFTRHRTPTPHQNLTFLPGKKDWTPSTRTLPNILWCNYGGSWTIGLTFFRSSEETKGLAESWTQTSSESPSISCEQTMQKISMIFMHRNRRSNYTSGLSLTWSPLKTESCLSFPGRANLRGICKFLIEPAEVDANFWQL